MPIEFRCSQCGKLLRTGDDTAGRQAQCPECGTISTVPAPAGPQGPSVPPPPLEGSSPFSFRLPVCRYGRWRKSVSARPAACYAIEVSAVQRVSGPATALIVYAILSIVVDSLLIVGMLCAMGFAPAGAHGEANDVSDDDGLRILFGRSDSSAWLWRS